MHSGLDLARPRRRRKWLVPLAAGVLLLAALPYLRAALPAGLAHLDRTLAELAAPGYTARLTELEQENALLHTALADAANALAENQSLRSLLGAERVSGRWQPARVIARYTDRLRLACSAQEGAAVTDSLGRYAGRVIAVGKDGSCEVALAGSEEAPCAGLCGEAAGLLEVRGRWTLTGLPADSTLAAGMTVTTPDGYWLGALAEPPQPDPDGLTARAPLTDTADLNSTVFFVKD